MEVTPKRVHRPGEREEGGTNSSVGVTKDWLQHLCLYTACGKSDHANHANVILNIFAWKQVLKKS